jgi:hypothetical protein
VPLFPCPRQHLAAFELSEFARRWEMPIIPENDPNEAYDVVPMPNTRTDREAVGGPSPAMVFRSFTSRRPMFGMPSVVQPRDAVHLRMKLAQMFLPEEAGPPPEAALLRFGMKYLFVGFKVLDDQTEQFDCQRVRGSSSKLSK